LQSCNNAEGVQTIPTGLVPPTYATAGLAPVERAVWCRFDPDRSVHRDEPGGAVCRNIGRRATIPTRCGRRGQAGLPVLLWWLS